MFDKLLERYDDASDESNESGGSSDQSDEDEDAEESSSDADAESETGNDAGKGASNSAGPKQPDEQQAVDPTTTLSTHRTICPPFVRLPPPPARPSYLGPQTSSSELLYLPFPATSYDRSEPVQDEDLMSADTDEEALELELDEEEVVEEFDRFLGAQSEKGLWAQFGDRVDGSVGPGKNKRKRPGDGEGVDDTGAKRRRKLAVVMDVPDDSGNEYAP